MAKCKPGPLASDMRGSMGGLTVQGGLHGLVLRGRMYGPSPASEAQQAATREFARIRKLFLALSKPDRAAWRSWVAERLYHDAMGQARHPSDWGAFYSTQIGLTRCGVAGNFAAPLAGTIDFPAVAIDPWVVTPVSCVLDVGAGPLQDDLYVSVYIGILSGHSGSKAGRGVRYTGMVGAGQESPFDWYSNWTAALGVPVTGQRFRWRFVPFQLSTRRWGVAWNGRGVVV